MCTGARQHSGVERRGPSGVSPLPLDRLIRTRDCVQGCMEVGECQLMESLVAQNTASSSLSFVAARVERFFVRFCVPSQYPAAQSRSKGIHHAMAAGAQCE